MPLARAIESRPLCRPRIIRGRNRRGAVCPLWVHKADVSSISHLCAAVIGSNVALLIRKRPLPEPITNGRIWPIPAVDAGFSQMAASGQLC